MGNISVSSVNRDVKQNFQGQIWNPWQKLSKKNTTWYNVTFGCWTVYWIYVNYQKNYDAIVIFQGWIWNPWQKLSKKNTTWYDITFGFWAV